MSGRLGDTNYGTKINYRKHALLLLSALFLLVLARFEAHAAESGQAHSADHSSPVNPAPAQKPESTPSLMIQKGAGYPVCRALLSSLMSIDPPRPLQSHMPLGRNPRGLSVPDWQPVNVQEHLDDIRLLFTERFKAYGEKMSHAANEHAAEIKAMMDADPERVLGGTFGYRPAMQFQYWDVYRYHGKHMSLNWVWTHFLCSRRLLRWG